MRLLTMGLLVGAALMLAHAGRAATFVVTTTDDGTDLTRGDGVCRTPLGTCTLRAAILKANALPGPDTITLPAGTFTLRIPGADEDAGVQGDLDITDDLVISGAGETASIINAKHIDRVFDVHHPAQVTLSGVTITNGALPAARPYPDARSDGGGMLNDGTVTLDHVTFLQNSAGPGSAWAGGFKNLGTATLSHVTFSRNHAGDGYCLPIGHADCNGDYAGSAGGMWNVGTASLTDVMFSDNRGGDASAAYPGDGGYGGGMWNDGRVTLTNVTFAPNRAGQGDYGGAGGLLMVTPRSRTSRSATTVRGDADQRDADPQPRGQRVRLLRERR